MIAPAFAQASVTQHSATQDSLTLSPQAEGVKYLSKAELQRMRQTVPIRQQLTTPPPPPQKYWVIYASEDWALVLVCKYSDETGKLLYCDVYV